MTDNEKIAMAKTNAHIPTEEVKQDIVDTQAEIDKMKREIKAYRLLGDKMPMFRANAREGGIKARQDFITQLATILEIRNRPNE